MILNINQLRSFYFAARLKSITRAAQELMVTPPAITIQIKQLEESLGIWLIFRDGHSMQLTEVGNILFKKCHAIFGQIAEMEDYLEDISRGKSGTLKIGCPQTAAKYVMPHLIKVFNRTYPGIKIILDQGNVSVMKRKIINRKVELAVIDSPPEDKRFKVKIFGKEEIVLIAAPRSQLLPLDEISVTQLPALPLVMSQKGAATRDVVVEYLSKFKISPKIVMESGSADLIKELVNQDTGVGFLVKSAVENDLKRNKLRNVRLLEGPPIIEYGIGYLNRKSLSPAAWSFLRLLDNIDDVLPNIKNCN